MKTATVPAVRRPSPQIKARPSKGQTDAMRKQRKVIARRTPVRPADEAYPDFAARRQQIFGRKVARQTGTELVAEQRGEQ